MRQLGRPALLAAMYSGDGPGAAAAAVAEVGGMLASSLHELERGSASSAGASEVFGALSGHLELNWQIIKMKMTHMLRACRALSAVTI